MKCNCPVCNGRDFNPAGIELAEKEIIPFFKRELLNLRYPTHPFPMKYDGLLASLFSYGQALAYNRVHDVQNVVYYTQNKWLLKYSKEMGVKFGMPVLHESELRTTAYEVCEYNTGGIANMNRAN